MHAAFIIYDYDASDFSGMYDPVTRFFTSAHYRIRSSFEGGSL